MLAEGAGMSGVFRHRVPHVGTPFPPMDRSVITTALILLALIILVILLIGSITPVL
jgi:hypothetical protein